MNNYSHNYKTDNKPAFSLVEMITVLVISALVLITAINIFSRIKNAAASVETMLKENELPNEILQRLAEDLDRLAIPGFETKINIINRLEEGYQLYQMTITNSIYNTNDEPQVFEKIIWQTYYDPFEDAMALYRLHTGMNLERKVTSEFGDILEDEGEVFVQLCSGMTHFSINVKQRDQILEQWISTALPKAIVATISFAPFKENEFGELEISEYDLISRTIAIDRTRNIPFEFVPIDLSSYDPNSPDSYIDPNKIGLP